jgi:hypothetical protein
VAFRGLPLTLTEMLMVLMRFSSLDVSLFPHAC